MTRAHKVWAAGLGTLVVLDLYCDSRADDSTLSCVTRMVYRTDTRAGRMAFVASWVALSSWLVPHICRNPRAFIPEI